jgi:hypothetical protein
MKIRSVILELLLAEIKDRQTDKLGEVNGHII